MLQTETKEIIQFIDTHLYPKVGNHFPKTHFSTSSKRILTELFRKIAHAESVWEYSFPKQFNIQAILGKDDFPRGKDFSFCPEDIKDTIVRSVKTGYVYTFMVNKRKIQVTIMHVGNTILKSAKIFQLAIQKIFLWLHVVSEYASPRCSQEMNIYIYWTQLKKNLPNIGKPIEAIHANTAFTTSCRETTELNLYRYEEWFKVFIHETFHNMGLDFSAHPQGNVVRHILTLFPVKSDVNLFETYTETWAEIIHVCFLAFFHTRNREDVENMILKTEKMIDYERMFSAYQCMKVLHFFGMNYQDLVEKTDAAHVTRMQKYKESTNVLSYYILKSLLLFFVDDFLEWCGEHNESGGIRFSTENVDETMIEYCQWIEAHYLQKEYVGILKKIEPWFHSKKAKGKSLEDIRRTMRMTVFG
jgi:hypothetical protein